MWPIWSNVAQNRNSFGPNSRPPNPITNLQYQSPPKPLSETTTNFGGAVAGDFMWPSLRQRTLSLSSEAIHQWMPGLNRSFCSSVINATNTNGKSGNVVELLNLEEVEKILKDVRADDVRVIPVRKQSEFTNFVVVATGRSQWHVRNIAQALIYKACSSHLSFIFFQWLLYHIVTLWCFVNASCLVSWNIWSNLGLFLLSSDG